MLKQSYNAQNAPEAIGPYCHAVKVGKMIFTSGQLGISPETGKLADGLEAQTIQAITNLRTILEEANSGLDCLVKTTVFVQNIGDFPLVNKIYGMLIPKPYPARSCVEVAKLPAGGLVEIEASAVMRD